MNRESFNNGIIVILGVTSFRAMEIENSIQNAEKSNKPFFAKRLRMMIQKKLEKINSLSEED